jgi:FMN-dependent NADH-azoreductase
MRSPVRFSEDTKEDHEKALASVRFSRSKSLKPEGTTDDNAKLVQLSPASQQFGKLPPLSPHRERGISEHIRSNPNPTLGLGDRRRSFEDDTSSDKRRCSSTSSNSRKKLLQEREDNLTKIATRGTSNISAEAKAAENRAVQRAIDLRRSRDNNSKEVIEADEKKKESLLVVTCSPNGAISTSNALARYFAEAFEVAFPEQMVTVLDLADADLVPPKDDTASEPASEGLALVKQFASHSKFLFAMPMWNLTVPSSLKQYFDLLLHPAHRYLRDKAKGWNTADCPVTMLATCGNSQLGGEQDFLTPYVNDIFQKLGFRCALNVP